MITRIIARFDASGLADYQQRLQKAYGSVDDLHHRVQLSGCGNPDLLDDLEIWRALQHPDATLRQVEEVSSFGIFDHLTARKVEILDFLRHYQVESIKDLASHLKRDYKRVYQDLQALADYGFVTFVREGKNRRPVCLVTDIEIEI